MEPAMAEGGTLAPVFSWLVGTGTGAGIALLFVFTGLLAALTGLSGYLLPRRAQRRGHSARPRRRRGAGVGNV